MPGIMGGLFGGSGGSSSSGTTTQQQTGSTSYPQWYTDYMMSTLGRAQDAANKPRQSYDTSKMFEPLNADQNAAFAAIRGMPGAYQPYASGAMGALNTAGTRDSQAAAQPYLDAAGNAVRPWEAGNANIGASAQGWNDPTVQASYMDPYVGGAINRANDLTQRQFLEKTMPGITSQFAKGTGQLGRSNYNQFTGQAVRNLAGEMSGNADTMMDKAFWSGAGQFNSDQARRQAAGVAQGNLANQNMGALRDLATTNAGITNQAMTGDINRANAWSNIGGQANTVGLANAAALRDVGNQEQQQGQLTRTADYQDWLAQQKYPFEMVNFLKGAVQGFQIPQTTSSTASTTQGQTGSSTGTPSVAGSILGTASALNTLGSSTDASGKTTGGLSNIYDWAKGQFNDGTSSGNQYGPPAPAARGGRIARRARGGALRDFDIGGSVPVERGIRGRRKPMMPPMGPPMGMAPPGPFAGPPGGALPGPGPMMPPMGPPGRPPMGPPRGALGMMR